MDNPREVARLLSVLLVFLYQRSQYNVMLRQFFALQRLRIRRRRRQFLCAAEIAIRYLCLARRVVRRAPRRFWVLPRPQHWFQQMLNDRALDNWWKENFRVTRATFEYICRLVGPELRREDTTMREAVPVEKRVSASLWRLATGECYRSCGLMMGLSKALVIKCCHGFVAELCRIQADFIQFPRTRADVQKKIDGFSDKSRIPNVVAAIDGSHVPIKAPKEHHEDYFNRKHFYSYVMQGVVDASGLYLSVSTGYPTKRWDFRFLSSEAFWLVQASRGSEKPSFFSRGLSWAFLLFFLMYPWIFNA